MTPGPSNDPDILEKTGALSRRDSDFQRSVQFDDVLIGLWGSISLAGTLGLGCSGLSGCCTHVGLLDWVVRPLEDFVLSAPPPNSYWCSSSQDSNSRDSVLE